MNTNQKILTGAAASLLLGLPVYQQTRIQSLQEEMTNLTAAASPASRSRVISHPPASAPALSQPPAHMAGHPSGTADTADTTGAQGPNGVVAKSKTAGPGEAVSARRGNGVVPGSKRAAETSTGGELSPLGFSGSLDESGQSAFLTPGGLVQWDHAQATGAPNTPEAGDRPTAWAPRSPKSGEQWLQLGYDKAVEMKEINIHESYNSGAISKVTALLPNGTEKTLWTGNATPGAGNEILETAVPVPRGVTASRIKVYVDTNRVGSWPEIDAVELVGTNGSRQWASTSSASSSYSELYSNQGGSQNTVEYEGTARMPLTRGATPPGN